MVVEVSIPYARGYVAIATHSVLVSDGRWLTAETGRVLMRRAGHDIKADGATESSWWCAAGELDQIILIIITISLAGQQPKWGACAARGDSPSRSAGRIVLHRRCRCIINNNNNGCGLIKADVACPVTSANNNSGARVWRGVQRMHIWKDRSAVVQQQQQ